MLVFVSAFHVKVRLDWARAQLAPIARDISREETQMNPICRFEWKSDWDWSFFAEVSIVAAGVVGSKLTPIVYRFAQRCDYWELPKGG